MNSQNMEPQLGAESFSCPHCNVVAHQDWYSLFLKLENATDVVVLTPEAANAIMLVEGEDDDGNESDQFVERLKRNALTYEYLKHPQSLKVKLVNLRVSKCYKCNRFAVWVRDRLVFPIRIDETPDLIEQDFEEAAVMFNKSPRAAAALINVCVQSLMPLLREQGKNLKPILHPLPCRTVPLCRGAEASQLMTFCV
jgi:hypothetical protein